jgi:hypothetical protein
VIVADSCNSCPSSTTGTVGRRRDPLLRAPAVAAAIAAGDPDKTSRVTAFRGTRRHYS